ncbi:MAG: Rpn family recombination-promoting nuclease/putative transposase [Armatimonadota bacterium]|nr:Rpn family recombination-promoting nuclease/putative transposase [Armatimonadota bacterium]
MLLGIDPKVDFAFKWLFGREADKAILIDLLHAILKPAAGEQIVDLEILNPFTEKTALDDKLSVLDIKARDAKGRYFNIEMQMVGFPALFQRILYYWGKVYTEQLSAGEDYSLLTPTISICFVDSTMLPGVSDYHSHFEITDNIHGVLFTEDLQIHLFELPKFNKSAEEITTGLDRWLYFLRHAQEMDRSILPETMDMPVIRQAMEALMAITQTDLEREIYEGRIKAWRDQRARQQHYDSIQAAYDALEAAKVTAEAAKASAEAAKASAEAAKVTAEAAKVASEARAAELAAQLARTLEQLSQGEQRAEQKGELVERISTLQHNLGQPPTPREELRALSLEELGRRAAALGQQLPRR